MRVFGPLLDLENTNAFVWLRAFRSLEERGRRRAAFYEGLLEAIAMPMLESYDVILTAVSPGFVDFDVNDPASFPAIHHARRRSRDAADRAVGRREVRARMRRCSSRRLRRDGSPAARRPSRYSLTVRTTGTVSPFASSTPMRSTSL